MGRQGTPAPSSEEAAARMRVTRQRDTPAELAIRRELHRRGFRYFVDRPIRGVTRGRPDLVFPRQKIAIFVDGCFWHSCPEHATMPESNHQWWEEKLAANVERDRRHDDELEEAGWTVLRFWEHEDPARAADTVEGVVKRRRLASLGGHR